MQRKMTDFFNPKTPIDIINVICHLLDLDTLRNLSQVNKSFHEFINNHLDFSELLKLHFPHRFQVNHPFTAYMKALKEEYAGLDSRQVALFTHVKEGQFDKLLKNIKEEDVHLTDNYGRRIIDWIWIVDSSKARGASEALFKFFVPRKPGQYKNQSLAKALDNEILSHLPYRLTTGFFSALEKKISRQEKEKYANQFAIVKFIEKILARKEDLLVLCHQYMECEEYTPKFFFEAIYTLRNQSLDFDIIGFILQLESIDKKAILKHKNNLEKLPVNSQVALAYLLAMRAIDTDNRDLLLEIEKRMPVFFDCYLDIAGLYLQAKNENKPKIMAYLEPRALQQPHLLHTALSRGLRYQQLQNLEDIKQLIEKGAALNGKNKLGMTPFWHAVINSYTHIAIKLLEIGADTTKCKLNTNFISQHYFDRDVKTVFEYQPDLLKQYNIARLKQFRKDLKLTPEILSTQNKHSIGIKFWKSHPSKQEMLDAAKVAKRYLRDKVTHEALTPYKETLESGDLADITKQAQLFKR